MTGEESRELAVEIIQASERLKAVMEELRAAAVTNKWSARALSIAITELETAQLWFANAVPDDEVPNLG
jgi:hypothetical protein